MPSLGARAIRILPFGLAACAIAALIVQNATAVALGDSDPDTVAAIWPGHPSANIALASREIASASGTGRAINPSAFAMLDRAAWAAPLEPQPFIVAGIRAQLAGKQAAAEAAFQAARLRDPRSLPARYFLASSKLQRGDVEGLRDVAALARLAPGGITNIAPYLAAFVQQQQSWGPIRAMFRDNPGVRAEVLSTLARDPANLRLVLTLGNTLDPAKGPWLSTMIGTLIQARRYDQARMLWARTAGLPAETQTTGLFDPDFRNATALPPFNWQLTSSSLGLAERRSGRLQVIHYGQQSGSLARQLLLLQPGHYRLLAPAKSGGEAESLQWQIRCDGPAPSEIGRASIHEGGLTFDVPANCPAQWLEIVGRASDFGREAEISIGTLSLTRVAER
jgi:hypothetical protein